MRHDYSQGEEIDVNIVSCVVKSDHYIFIFDWQNRANTLRTLGRYASNKDLNFTWKSAAAIAEKIREMG